MTLNDRHECDCATPPAIGSSHETILIAIHGVGSPAIGATARNVGLGFADAYPNAEIEEQPWRISIGAESDKHVFEGIRIKADKKSVQIWEVNWADLKGLPDGVIGTALYALKALIASVQLSHTGWDPQRRGVTGPLLFGRLLRAYFCFFVLVAPLNLLLIAYAFVQCNAPVASLVITVIAVLAGVLLFLLSRIDTWIRFAFVFLAAGVSLAFWLIAYPTDATALLINVVEGFGLFEMALGAILLFAIAELLAKFLFAKNTAEHESVTVFLTRAGMIILAVSIGASAYGALLNAAGFFALDRLISWGLADQHAIAYFGILYRDHIGYGVAQIELVNGATTFFVGSFLLISAGFQLLAIGASSDAHQPPRGLRVRNSVNVFLWLTLFGLLFVLATTVLDWFKFFDPSGPLCVPNALCSIYGIQWLLDLLHVSDRNNPLTPVEIYAASATRILPFILLTLLPRLRVGLNVGADVLLYVLPPRFSLSLKERANDRLRRLLTYLHNQHADAKIAIMAHSQGSVIAKDVLSEMSSTHVRSLVTAGSPLASLYRRFLGRGIKPIQGCTWTNTYRLSDYIGGPLSDPEVADVILTHNYCAAHFLYFEDGAVVKMTF